MNIRSLWGRITGADKKLNYPEQQTSFIGRIGDYTIIYPYGMYCDLPNNTLLRQVGSGASIPVTVKRESDAARGEIVLFNPTTTTRVILRNNGDIDILADGSNLNVKAKQVNVEADDVNVDAKNINMTSEIINLEGTAEINLTSLEINMNGPMASTGALTSNGKDISSTHKHEGSPTSPNGPITDTGEVV